MNVQLARMILDFVKNSQKLHGKTKGLAKLDKMVKGMIKNPAKTNMQLPMEGRLNRKIFDEMYEHKAKGLFPKSYYKSRGEGRTGKNILAEARRVVREREREILENRLYRERMRALQDAAGDEPIW